MKSANQHRKSPKLMALGGAACVIFLVLGISGSTAGAHAPSEAGQQGVYPKPEDVIAVKTFETEAQGKVHVVIRKDGHVLAKPFIVEIRPQCKSKKTNWRELRVADMESACKVEVESLSMAVDRGEITIQIHDTDAEDYRRRSLRSPGRVVPKCLKQPTLFTVPLANLCR
jgi:hypothetical protein